LLHAVHAGSFHPCRDPLGWRVVQAIAKLQRLLLDLVPVGLGQGIHQHGQEDLLLLDDHLPDPLDRRFQDDLGRCQQLFAGDAGRFEDVEAAPQQVPDLVVLAPHHLGRTGHSRLLQVGEQQVFLAQVVLVHVHELVELRDVDRGLPAGRRPFPARAASRACACVEHGRQRPVLLQKDVHRVALGNRPRGAQVDVALQDGRVDVAQLEHLFHGQALFQQLLLDLDHLAVGNGAQGAG
jgi:hypothetical protein